MREILFRGKRIDNGEWVYGNYAFTDVNGKKYFIFQNKPLEHEVIPETVGQYIGLTDKNGKKIFEGDIVKYHFGEGKGVVKLGEYQQPFNDDVHTNHIGFYVDWLFGKEKGLLRKDLGYWANLDNNNGFEIFIGNIHDNPELLESVENG